MGEARLTEEKRLAEIKRLEEARLAEKNRLEEVRLKEEAKLRKETKLVEETRLAEVEVKENLLNSTEIKTKFDRVTKIEDIANTTEKVCVSVKDENDEKEKNQVNRFTDSAENV